MSLCLLPVNNSDDPYYLDQRDFIRARPFRWTRDSTRNAPYCNRLKMTLFTFVTGQRLKAGKVPVFLDGNRHNYSMANLGVAQSSFVKLPPRDKYAWRGKTMINLN